MQKSNENRYEQFVAFSKRSNTPPRLVLMAVFLVLVSSVIVISNMPDSEDSSAYPGGVCGTSLFWEYNTDTNTLSITGTGDMNLSYQPWSSYRSSMQHLVLPSTLTSISDNAFSSCANLTGNLVIPDSVTTIGYNAFDSCRFTGDLVIPDSVTTIGGYAFKNCHGFDGKLVIPDSVTTIGYNAFEDCYGFSGDLEIPDSVTTIGDHAFDNCHGFDGKLVIPDSVTTIGNYVFEDCFGFTGDLEIPDSVTTIGDYAFNNCHGFNGKLVIPDSVTTIGNYVFEDCYRFTGDLVIPDSVTTIGNSAFDSCRFTGDLVIPDSVTTIGNSAFAECYGFTGDLVIPNSVTTIGVGAFAECYGFTGDLVIPDSVTTIGDYAFSSCPFTGDLVIPNSVTTIGVGAFAYSGFDGDLIISDSVTTIENYTFDHCVLLKHVTIPDSVSSINDYAFRNCLLLEHVTIPDSVNFIGNAAFADCHRLISLKIPDSVGSIGSNAFANCSAIDTVTVTLASGKASSTYVLQGGYLGPNWTLPYSGATINKIIIDADEPISLANINANYALGSKTLILTAGSSNTTGGTLKDKDNIVLSDGDRANKTYYNDTISSFREVHLDVTLDPNGGSVTPTVIHAVNGATYGALPTPTKIGYAFDGWYTAATGGTHVSNTTIVSTPANHTLVALWSLPPSSSHSIIVSFDSDGGSHVNDKSVKFGFAYGTLATPTKDGFTFDGWYFNGEMITSSSIVNTNFDHTLVAHWSPVTDINEGETDDDSGDGNHGFNIRDHLSKIIVALGALLLLLLLIFAFLRRSNVVFDENGGSEKVDSMRVKRGESFSIPDYTGYKEGFTFAGWNDGTTTYSANSEYQMNEKKVRFTAVWE